MQPQHLLADPTSILLEKIIQHPVSLTLVVRTTLAQAECPCCHRPSSRVHSYYTRTVGRLSPEVRRAQELALSFVDVVKERRVEDLRRWVIEAQRSEISEFVGLANGLTTDLQAVRAALGYEWSQGQVEGQVHRLKLVKRQMYGRGKLDLLRARVLRAA